MRELRRGEQKYNETTGDPAAIARRIHVPTYDEILEKIRSRYPRGPRHGTPYEKEIARLQTIYNILISKTNFIRDLTRLLDTIHPFFWDLIKIEFDETEIHNAIKCVSRSRRLSSQFWDKYRYLLLGADNLKELRKLSAEARGRILSTVKRCRKQLEVLRSLVVFLSKLPAVDPSLKTIIVSGAPSTGKSTFISTASRANPRVSPFPFTTKSIHIGHIDIEDTKIQLVDTPGILDRPPEEMNYIERKAVSALRHIQGVVLLLIDVSQNPTISVERQMALLNLIKNTNKNIYIMLNKVDDASPENLNLARTLAGRALSDGSISMVFEGSATDKSTVVKIIRKIASREGWIRA